MASLVSNNDERWGAKSHVPDNMGLAVRPMGLKVHYTFDQDSHTNCLARWPHVLQIQIIPLDENNTIGLVNLWTCLLAIAQCSPELAGDNQRDYTVYAVDYSEPDTPLVGQGIFGWILEQGPDGSASSQMVVGRVTKNMLALFGNGIKETLEVRLKLTAVPKVGRGASTPAPQPTCETSARRTLTRTASTMSENAEWNSFIQSNPNLGQRTTSIVSSPALAPVQPYSSNCEPRSDILEPSFPMPRGLSESRPPSVGPNVNRLPPVPIPPLSQTSQEDQNLFGHAAKVGRAQSRPSSRASTKSTKGTGRPRGRPRKKPHPVEGNTSGYEDGTDADDGPPQRKRAKTTKVERSNTATFGSAPESLRVAASTSGSLRNFRPIAPGGDGPAGNHLQEVPRAPTPIPDYRMPGLGHQRPVAPSNLRRQSTSGQDQGNSLTSSYMDMSRSMSQSQDARSPPDFLAPSPSQNYSDAPSPTDIGSSPPVPRSAMYSLQSSPAPSSPILPPMPAAQPDSGFMSGGFEDDRADVDMLDKSCFEAPPPPQPATKPKTKRSRSKKKQPEREDNLVIQSEIPGPPELLPTTSLYNPPDKAKRNTPNPNITAERGSSLPQLKRSASMISEVQTLETEPQERHFSARFPSEASQDIGDLERAFMAGFNENQQVRDVSMDAYTPAGETPAPSVVQPSIEQADPPMNPPPLPAGRNCEEEPELPPPMVPASDPVVPQLTLPTLASEPAHPQTDMPGPLQGRSNKNYVRRQAIKQKLDEAIANGQMPPYCSNCGAIQTPTWRKVWKQEHAGIPAYHEYSDKPGHVTAINVLQRSEDGKPCQYEMIKKALGPDDDKNAWVEVLLCNPCGIWFSKWKALRPPEKWEKDADRLTQIRKKRSNGEPKPPRTRKSRTKSDPQAVLTSEACLPTDPLGPTDAPHSPGDGRNGGANPLKGGESTHSRAGSTHSRGSGTPGSPILLDESLGATRRLLFPSPRKEGEQKVLGDVAVNIVQTSPEYQKLKNPENSKGKETDHEKENDSAAVVHCVDDFADLFGTPLRPSTPPPKSANSGPFKTPTRQSSNHRPITRSVSRSIRSTRSLKSPSQALMLQRTPTKTPHSAKRKEGCKPILPIAESPFTRSINQLLSEANEFVSPHHGLGFDLDFSMDTDTHAGPAGHFDFGTLLSTDGITPSSPPIGLQHGMGGHMQVAFSDTLTFDDGADLWKHLAAGPGGSFEETGEGAN